MPLNALRQPNPPIQALVVQYGRQAVADELQDMCYEDMADVALNAALAIDETRVVRIAAHVVLDGTYLKEAKDLASEVLGRKAAD